MSHSQNSRSLKEGLGLGLARLCAGIGLICIYVLMGFSLVAFVPQVSQSVARFACNSSLSVFSTDELVIMADATRSYALGNHSSEDLQLALTKLNESAKTRDPELYKQYASGENSTGSILRDAQKGSDEDIYPIAPPGGYDDEGDGTTESPVSKNKDAQANKKRPALKTQAPAVEENPSLYLTPDAVSHLDDVHRLTQGGLIVACILASLGGACLIYIARRRGRYAVATLMKVSSLVCLLGLIALVGWCVFGFDAAFTLFHHIAFPWGNWSFPIDSLLICMFPPLFWLCMGGLWAAATAIVALLFALLGKIWQK